MPRAKTMRIVVVGGGTGTYTALTGLKTYVPRGVELSAIVTVADNGGSTGRLRDAFGYLPVGDVRMALAALAEESEPYGLIRQLFMYRFGKGEGLQGHNIGNLLLVALRDILGSEEAAIAAAARILRVAGRVIPVSTDDVTLCAEYADGSQVRGETLIDEPPREHNGTLRITRVWLEPQAALSHTARRALSTADLVVFGPGDLYTSILPNIIVTDFTQALSAGSARIVYSINLMTRWAQTHGFTATDYVEEFARYVGRLPDAVLLNNAPIPASTTAYYAQARELPVVDDLHHVSYQVVRTDLLATEEVTRTPGDTLHRSLLRHDPAKLAAAIMSLTS